MANPAVKKILDKIGQPELMGKLVEACTASELNSLLLEVFRVEALLVSPTDLMRQYNQNRFVKPSSIDQIEYLEAELPLLKLAARYGFTSLELSPLAPLGSCSSIALVDQNKVISALRGTEVIADATNLLALEASQKRMAAAFDDLILNLCNVQRLVRAQALPPVKGFTSHFKIFSAVTAGRDTGNLEFEKKVMLNHLRLYEEYLADQLKVSPVKITIKELDENPDNTAGQKIFEYLQKNLNAYLERLVVPKEEHQYYDRFRFSIDVMHNNHFINLGDGGFVDWSQELTSNKKERMFISGLGLELLLKMLKGSI